MNVLVIASHPDDEVLGCGGTIAKHVRDGDIVNVLYLSRGRLNDVSHIGESCMILGVHQHFMSNFSGQNFETISQARIADAISLHLKNLSIDIVYTHSANDLNKDHKVAYEATMLATRPNTDYSPSKVYSYEIMGSNFQYNQSSKFAPTHYVNVINTIDQKVDAMVAYVDELNIYPQPRSIGGILIYAEFRGLECGMKYVEAFETVRSFA